MRLFEINASNYSHAGQGRPLLGAMIILCLAMSACKADLEMQCQALSVKYNSSVAASASCERFQTLYDSLTTMMNNRELVQFRVKISPGHPLIDEIKNSAALIMNGPEVAFYFDGDNRLLMELESSKFVMYEAPEVLQDLGNKNKKD